jgi:hypothetical protein
MVKTMKSRMMRWVDKYSGDEKTTRNFVVFEVFTAVAMKNSIFGNIAPCYLLHAGLLDLKDGGDICLRNVG